MGTEHWQCPKRGPTLEKVLNGGAVSYRTAGRMLIDFREYRAERTGKRPTDWVMPPPDQRPDYEDFTKKRPKE